MDRILVKTFQRIIILLAAFIFFSCQKEKIAISKNVFDNFFIKREGASMPITIAGNIESKVILIYLPAKLGESGLIYRTSAMQSLENEFAVAYVDQRNSGNSQGNSKKPANLNQMSKDLDLLIDVLKKRYGKKVSFFVMGHGFGAMTAMNYISTDTLQFKLKGWINAAGFIDYPNLPKFAINKYSSVGQSQIKAGVDVAKWEPIVKWCESRTDPLKPEDEKYLENLDGEALMANLINNYPISSKKQNLKSVIEENDFAIASYALNYLSTSSEKSAISKDVTVRSFIADMPFIKIPTLFMVGEHDFITPANAQRNAMNQMRILSKSFVVFPKSGHQLHINEPDLFLNNIKYFMRLNKDREYFVN